MRNKNKTVLIVGPKPPPYNGMSVVTENLINSKLKNEFNLIHLDIADRRGLVNVGKLDFENVRLALLHGLKFFWILLTKNPNLIYLNISQNFYGVLRDSLFLFPTYLFRKKMIIHLHGSEFRNFYETSSNIVKFLLKSILNRTEKVIVLGEKLKGIFNGIVPDNKIVVIPNGIYISETIYNDKVLVKENKDTINVTYLGSLKKSKGFLDLLECVPALREKALNIKFCFAGEISSIEDKHQAERIINENKIDELVKFIGVVEGKSKEKLLIDTDIFVFPPNSPEGQPLVILEAMGAGLPIITTNQGAISETVSDGINGFIIPEKDPKSLIEKIVLLSVDKNLRVTMGKASREIYLKYFTQERWIEDLMQLFRNTLIINNQILD